MNTSTFVGNLTADPQLRFTNEKPRATFSIAVNEGEGEQEKTHFINVTCFGTLAENVASSLHKGQRVIVHGRFNTYSKAVQVDGEDKNLTMLSITGSAVGPDLRWAEAKVTKVVKSDGGNGNGGQNSGGQGNGDSGQGSSNGSGRGGSGSGNSSDESSGRDRSSSNSGSSQRSGGNGRSNNDDDF